MANGEVKINYPHVTVRSLRQEDGRDVQALLQNVWRDTYVEPGFITPEQLDRFANPDSYAHEQGVQIAQANHQVERGLPDAVHYLGAEQDGTLVGVLKWYPLTAEQRFSTMNSGNPDDPNTWRQEVGNRAIWLAYIEELDVLRRRRRIGSALFHAAIGQIRQTTINEKPLVSVELDVVRNNRPAQDFYRTIGLFPLDLHMYFPGLRGNPNMVLEAMSGQPYEVEGLLEKRLGMP